MKRTIGKSSALTLLLYAGAVFAQNNETPAPAPIKVAAADPAPAPVKLAAADEAPASLEQVIVTGTRITGLKVEDSASPIQVLDASTIAGTGEVNLMEALGQAVPSLQVEAFGADTAALTISARLRGLSANDTLVLINGKRRHGTANLTVDTGNPFIGSAAADLSLIPVDAISRIEVLTDGAAAQYGTDAIAGVVNIILKRDDHGGKIDFEGGKYFDGGGATGDLSGNFGFKPFDGAFANLTIESRYHGYSNRGATDPRVVDPGNLASQPSILTQPGYPYVNKIFGDPSQRTLLLTLNAGADISDTTSLYAYATYAHKYGLSYENYRLPSKIPQVYPSGFNPSEGITENDFAVTLGAKTMLGSWNLDASSTFGSDIDQVGTYNTASPDLFAATGTTPTDFHDGEFHLNQWTNTLDLNKDFNVGWAAPLNVAFGVEWRTDSYELDAGDPAARFGSGPSSYPGFTLTDAGVHNRENEALYVDLAGKPTKEWTVDLAGRTEHYSDFGNATIGKATTRYDFTPQIGIRGTISNGFRAPTQAEEYYSATNVGPSTAFVQLPPGSPGAALVGINGLKPEKSDNLSFGVILRPTEKSSVSLDAYQITIRDRIVGSGNVFGSFDGVIQSSAVNAAIAANGNVLDQAVVNSPIGQTGINIFSNAASTKTKGAEFVATLASDYGSIGRVDWSVAAAYNITKVTSINQEPSQLAPQALLNLTAISQLETASPRLRVNLGGVWHIDTFTINLRENYYGESSDYEQDDSGVFHKDTINPHFITNLSVSDDITKSWNVTVGANNLFNTYPEKLDAGLLANYRANLDNSAVGQYPNFSPFGINGGFYYGKVTYRF